MAHLIRLFLLLLPIYDLACSARSILPAAEHNISLNKRLPAAWHHREDHPVHSLFRRESTDGVQYAQVGSPSEAPLYHTILVCTSDNVLAWSAPYPTHSPDPSNLPQAWVDALDAAVSAGKIPDIPQSTMDAAGNPTYPKSFNPTSDEVCSGTYKCRIDGDIWDAPDGVVGACFDDGPLPVSYHRHLGLSCRSPMA